MRPLHVRAKGCPQPLGHRSRSAVAHLAELVAGRFQEGEAGHRHGLAERAGHEDFVRRRQGLRAVWLLPEDEAFLAGDLDEEGAGDAFQHPQGERSEYRIVDPVDRVERQHAARCACGATSESASPAASAAGQDTTDGR